MPRALPLTLIPLLALPCIATAHFQELIPAREGLSDPGENPLALELRFTHPMAGGPVMAMGTPVRFGVQGPQGTEDLLPTLQPVAIDGGQGFHAEYRVRRPGDHSFFLEPAPYWEPAEGRMICHYTKVVVDGLGGGGGWDRPVGLPVEIEPLVRPYGLWSGNLFRGIVRHNGAPVPFATVEVEWRNDGSLTPPADAFATQVIKADPNGVFAYAMPRAGWWGFAALIEGETPLKGPDGRDVPVELGGLIWVRTHEMR